MIEPAGLSPSEVAERVARAAVNSGGEQTSRSVAQILRANLLTRFNALLGTLLVLVLATGAWQDATFGLVLAVNALLGVVQELRAKRSLDRLAVLSTPQARVRRGGATLEIPLEQVVLDDVVHLRAGDQVPADATVLAGAELELDESLLTGESDPVPKPAGMQLLSGSVVVAGQGYARVTGVGADAYARRLAAQARRFSLVRSELVAGINRLLQYLTWVLVVVGPVLLITQLHTQPDWRQAVTGTSAGLVGMIPEGLVLLTTLAFLVAALDLARRSVLVQELPAVEVLARVDTICLDKTGTLTDGQLTFTRAEALLPPGAATDRLIADAVGALAQDEAANGTLQALGRAFPAPDPSWVRTGGVPFSSARKWSAVAFAGRGAWLLGAPEFLLTDAADGPETAGAAALRRAEELAGQGHRVLLLARTDPLPEPGAGPPRGAEPVALLVLDEQLRPDAAETLRFFVEQQVEIKVISGDNPRTIGAVARRAGVPGADRVLDARTLPAEGTDPAGLAAAVEAHAVFGRVTPEQKRAMVHALQSRGHVVAMTGDGVNDVLALKDADLGVAMGSGAPATRSVARLVLVDNRFGRLPAVLAEGRRVIANIERVASLFVIKNVYSAILSLAVAVASVPFPFLPRQLTVISTLTIGLPAFVLALAPNRRRYRPGFLTRVLRFSVPGGALIGVGVFAAYALARLEQLPTDQARTVAGVTVMLDGLWVLVLLARPLTAWKAGLVTTMAAAYLACLLVPPVRSFLALAIPLDGLGTAVAIAAAVAVAVTAVHRLAEGSVRS